MNSTHPAGVALEMRWLQPLYHRLSGRPDLLRALELETGLRRTDPSDRSLLDHASLCHLIERLHAANEPHACAWLALQFDASVGSGQVYFLRSCAQLRELLAELMTNQPLLLPFGFFGFFIDLQADSFEVRLQPHRTPVRLAELLLAEGALAWLKRILDLSLSFSTVPIAARSMAPPAPCAEPLEALLGAPVQFDAPHGSLRYPLGLLDLALPGGNPRIKHAMRMAFVAQLRHSDAPRPLSRRLIGCLLTHDGAGRASIEGMASRLGMSGRDMRRQLMAEGMRFADIHNAHRRRQAFQLLVQEGTPVEAAARSLGYASRASLERAFANWFDTTPALARQARLQLAALAIDEDWSDPVPLLRMLPTSIHGAVDAAVWLQDLEQPAIPVLQAYLLGLANRAEYGGQLLHDASGLAGPLRPARLGQLVQGLQLQAGPGRPVADLEPLWHARLAALARLPGLPWFEALSADEQRRTQQDLAWYELGALLMYRLVGAPYGRLLEEAAAWPRARLLEQERLHFGLDRHMAGAMLLSAWGLPRHAIHTQRAASHPATLAATRLAALYEPVPPPSGATRLRTEPL
ncbi:MULTISPECIES: helix-turn-helix domain-containing protein [unclassified Acidovorax]|uniref:helix-turn-helix domain-containing protein n=1 Tax=unclassified Acidovorax TaxID=2684926 RepID=UPI001304AD50|nr:MULTISPECIES: helix-turn-helix domain-containing protein [unclassified Acidovorax]MDH4419444.1 helix-turn-helix domain-containing protein [Acidovorax sp.]